MKYEQVKMSKHIVFNTGGFGRKNNFCDLYKDVHVMTMNNYKTSLRIINWDKEADDM